MRAPRVQPEMVGGLASLPELLKSIARGRGLDIETREAIAAALPTELAAAPCFLDRLTSLWRYDFGEPLSLSGGRVAYGTHMYQEVEVLLNVLLFVERRLNSTDKAAYLARLSVPQKHEDVLVECAPVLRLDDGIPVQYERPGSGVGGSLIDWTIGDRDAPTLLLEVKNRSLDLLDHLTRVDAGELDGKGEAPQPAHSVDALFRSVEAKFPSTKGPEPIHTVWIHTSIKQDEQEFAASFARLDPSRVHCAILGGWDSDVYAVARDTLQAATVLRVLRMEKSTRFVFQRA